VVCDCAPYHTAVRLPGLVLVVPEAAAAQEVLVRVVEHRLRGHQVHLASCKGGQTRGIDSQNFQFHLFKQFFRRLGNVLIKVKNNNKYGLTILILD